MQMRVMRNFVRPISISLYKDALQRRLVKAISVGQTSQDTSHSQLGMQSMPV